MIPRCNNHRQLNFTRGAITQSCLYSEVQIQRRPSGAKVCKIHPIKRWSAKFEGSRNYQKWLYTLTTKRGQRGVGAVQGSQENSASGRGESKIARTCESPRHGGRRGLVLVRFAFRLNSVPR